MNEKDMCFAKLIEYKRNNITEQEHSGLIIHVSKKGILNKVGEDNGAVFFQRSCMKPLQAASVIDLNLDEKYGFNFDEIALFCASHTGDLIHREKINSVLNKLDLSENDLLCPAHEPLSIEERNRLIKNSLSPDKIHNNCSGKHCAMLAICKSKDFPYENYNDINHPLNELVIKRVCELCELEYNDVVIGKDGCTLPVIASPLENLAKGFLNLFCSNKYQKIKNAFIKYPYLIGGKGRLDSEIIHASENLVAKVGAGGLCCVVNLDKEECIVIKIADCNMEARAHSVINAIKQLEWFSSKEFFEKLNKIYPKEITTQSGEIIGEISAKFSLY